MKDEQLIRTPSLSGSRVVLKSGADTQPKMSQLQEKPAIEDAPKAPSVIYEDDVSRKYSEYQQAIEETNRLKQELLAEKDRLNDEWERLQKEKQNFKVEIESELKHTLERAYEEKYKDGLANLSQMLDGLVECKAAEISNFEDELISIVYEAVCKIIGRTAVEKDVVVSTVGEVVSHAQDRMDMVIRVCPDHLPVLRQAKESLGLGLSHRLEVVADDHVVYGGCILETSAGEIDGRLEQQLRGLMSVLLEERKRKHEDKGLL